MSYSPSSSASGSSAIDNRGPGITINPPNIVGWIVGGVVVLFGLVFWLKTFKKK